MTNPYNAYKQASVNTVSAPKLLLMLFDGLLRFMEQAVDALDKDDVQESHKYLIKAQDIILELRSSLEEKHAPELTSNLYELYSFFYTKLVEANREKSAAPVNEIQEMVRGLRDSFAEAAQQLATEEVNN